MILEATYHIEGILKLLTGLHIGSGEGGMRIGGIDNPVIKTVNNAPYIPGSSLKGKMRSELEWKYKNIENEANRHIGKYNEKAQKDGKDSFEKLDKKEQVNILSKVMACNCGVCDICKVFGHTNTDQVRFTRAIFRDIYLENPVKTEIKAENTISRITSEATPRHIERVPADSKFNLKIVFKKYPEDDIALLKLLFEGLQLLEDSFLGGGGTRGNGQVKFKELAIYKRTVDTPERASISISYKTPDDIVKNFDVIKDKF